MKCPCVDCICLPICRHKYVGRLFHECKLVDDYIPPWSTKDKMDLNRVFILEDILKPDMWHTSIDSNGKPEFHSKVNQHNPSEPMLILKMMQ